tara:strand:- start:4539 stop:4673 length:135 start_codon:yes stop_codon:yes gene_type:complete
MKYKKPLRDVDKFYIEVYNKMKNIDETLKVVIFRGERRFVIIKN